MQHKLLAVLLCLLGSYAAWAGNSSSGKDSSQTFQKHFKTYVGIMHPILFLEKSEVTTNFVNSYKFNVPVGINFWATKQWGYSLEFTPNIKVDKNNIQMTQLLFHPGALYKAHPNHTFAFRLAFETSGRVGFTPIYSIVLTRIKETSLFTSILFPCRWGNNALPTFSLGVLVGFSF